mmetsp:Transcript_18761/g.40959  ORF Transcript_18761/g.40959 Transcript_18761/m.40959 type:complete len:293 (-) Transcript_18761:96-974(-)
MLAFQHMPAPLGLSPSLVCCCHSFRCPSFDLGVTGKGQMFTLSSVVHFPRDRPDNISDSGSWAQASSELCIEGKDPKTAMLPPTEIGPRVADCAFLNPSDEFCDSPRDRLLAKLDADIGEATQVKPRKRRHRAGAALKEVTLEKPDSENVLDCSVEADAPVWPETATTVMLRNIPNRYTVEEILAEVRDKNFDGLFDFVYLPIDFQLKRNKGYAFINFDSPRTRARFVSVFDGYALTRYATRKVLQVVPAITQGFQENMAKYNTKDAVRVTNQWFRPMVFPLTVNNLAEALQ